MKLEFKKFGAGCPLIFLHGLYGSGDNWFTFGRELSSYFTVYLPDQRNHGSSLHHPDMNFEILTSDLEEFFIQQNIEHACLIGHSMGGKVAMNFTLRNPEKVKKLVVLDVAMRSYSPTGNFAQQANLHQKLVEILLKLDITKSQSRRDIDEDLRKDIPNVPLRQFLLKNLNRNADGSFFWGLNIESIHHNLIELLAKIDSENRSFNGPVLIIRGKKSGYILEEDFKDFYSAFPNSRIEEFDTGHWVHAEEPERLMKLLIEFLPL